MSKTRKTIKVSEEVAKAAKEYCEKHKLRYIDFCSDAIDEKLKKNEKTK